MCGISASRSRVLIGSCYIYLRESSEIGHFCQVVVKSQAARCGNEGYSPTARDGMGWDGMGWDSRTV